MESIAGEVAPDMALVWLGIVVALEVEDPEGIQVGMYWHMQSICWDVEWVRLAIILLAGVIAGLATFSGTDRGEEGQQTQEYDQLPHGDCE